MHRIQKIWDMEIKVLIINWFVIFFLFTKTNYMSIWLFLSWLCSCYRWVIPDVLVSLLIHVIYSTYQMLKEFWQNTDQNGITYHDAPDTATWGSKCFQHWYTHSPANQQIYTIVSHIEAEANLLRMIFLQLISLFENCFIWYKFIWNFFVML